MEESVTENPEVKRLEHVVKLDNRHMEETKLKFLNDVGYCLYHENEKLGSQISMMAQFWVSCGSELPLRM